MLLHALGFGLGWLGWAGGNTYIKSGRCAGQVQVQVQAHTHIYGVIYLGSWAGFGLGFGIWIWDLHP